MRRLYYVVGSDSINPESGAICIGMHCGAQVCTAEICWGHPLPEEVTTDAIVDYIQNLEGDFGWLFEGLPEFEAFKWNSWSKEDNLWTAQFNYATRMEPLLAMEAMLESLTSTLSVSADWFTIVLGSNDKDLGAARLFVADPEEDALLGGFVDILFFSGTAESASEITCRIHDSCESSYFQKRNCNRQLPGNLIGEYSGDNHVREQDCIAGFDSSWGHLKVSINTERTGGVYSLVCDETCEVCYFEGSFEGDECICYQESTGASGTPYKCISVKFASSTRVRPFVVVTLLVLVFSVLL